MPKTLDFDELDVLASTLYRETENLPPEERKKQVCDELEDILLYCYIFGINRVQESAELTEEESEKYIPSGETIYETLYKPVDGEDFRERVSRRIDEGTLGEYELQRIVETDGHRVSETGANDTAKVVSYETGMQFEKVWETMRDPRVRDTHDYLQSMRVGLDEVFVTYDGDYARFPGDFKKPENVINCRCWVEYKPKKNQGNNDGSLPL